MRITAASAATMCIVTLSMLISSSSAQERIRIDPTTQKYYDVHGRQRVFHGLNAVYKLPPYHPSFGAFDTDNSMGPEDLKLLREWGFNAMRVGVMWEAVEKVEGSYNTTYLDIMVDYVKRMGDAGIYSIIDAHQDSLNRKFCGEGIPDWAVNSSNSDTGFWKFPSPLPVKIEYGPDGYPTLDSCLQIIFSAYMFSFAEAEAWGNLWHDGVSVHKFAGFWNSVANAFNNTGAVLGYELINEPFLNDVWKHPIEALEAGKEDLDNLFPFYQTVYKAIREADPETIVMYEPTVVEDDLYQSTGFTTGPGGPEDNDRQAFAYHVYCINQNKTNGDITNVAQCDEDLDKWWALAQKGVKQTGGGSFMTEFGAVGAGETSAEALDKYTSLAETTQESWTYWTYKSFQDITTQNGHTETMFYPNGTVQERKLRALSRTYAPAVAGMLGSVRSTFNSTSGSYILSYENNPKCTAPTEVYLNEAVHYPNGFTYTVTPVGAATVTHVSTNNLEVVASEGASAVTLTIEAK